MSADQVSEKIENKYEGEFGEKEKQLIYCRRLTPNEIAILLVFFAHPNEPLSSLRIHELTGIGRDSVRKYLSNLAKLGWIERLKPSESEYVSFEESSGALIPRILHKGITVKGSKDERTFYILATNNFKVIEHFIKIHTEVQEFIKKVFKIEPNQYLERLKKVWKERPGLVIPEETK